MTATRALRALLILPLVVTVTGCGPRSGYDVGVARVAQDQALGDQATPSAVPVPVPLPGANLEPGTPGFLVPPAPVRTLAPAPRPTAAVTAVATAPPTPAPAEACPAADPASPIAVQAAQDVSQAPKPGVYHYRQVGGYVAGKTRLVFPATVDLTVKPSYVGRVLPNGQHDPSDSSIYWDQVETTIAPDGSKDATVTDTFRLVPGTEIDIFSIVVSDPSGLHAFQPQGPNAAQYAVFPVASRPVWSDTAVDGLHQEVFNDAAATHGANDRVDACGTNLDAIRIDVSPTTGGTKSQSDFEYPSMPSQSYDIDGWYDIGTQYDGLLLAESITETARDGSFTITRSLTIDSVTPDAAH